MKDNSIMRLQHFFTVDTKIKKEMYENTPPDSNGFLDTDSLIKYTDKLDDVLNYIFCELKCIANDFFSFDSLEYEKVELLEKQVKSTFYNCGIDIKKLREMYKNCITNMNSQFVDIVKKECVGYKLFKEIEPASMVTSVNELLHLFHCSILNNEEVLNEIPLIGEKINDYNYPINFRGVNTPLFYDLFQNFPCNIDCGWTDMVAVNDRKLIMMVRDRGHALSIEVSINKNVARIEYFIPKLCNVEMINNLPGINKVNEDSVGATGVMEVDVDELAYRLFDFISRVPMDSDMIHAFLSDDEISKMIR